MASRAEQRGCLRKTGLSKARADMIIDDCADNGVLMYYYRCKFCLMYHMTKMEPGTRKKTKVKAKYRRK